MRCDQDALVIVVRVWSDSGGGVRARVRFGAAADSSSVVVGSVSALIDTIRGAAEEWLHESSCG
jgi:hypothetical protein